MNPFIEGDLISRSALIEAHPTTWMKQYAGEAPAVDAVPVVRCKDCFRCIRDSTGLYFCKVPFDGRIELLQTMAYGFCSNGDRRTEHD